MTCPTAGQVKQKKHLTPVDYPLWGTLQLEEFSERGQWVSYAMQYEEQQTDTLFLKNTENRKLKFFPKGSNGQFNKEESFACLVPSGLAITNLKTNQQQLILDAIAFDFSSNAKYTIVLKRNSKNQKSLEIRSSNGEGLEDIKDVNAFLLNDAANKLVCSIESNNQNSVMVINLDKNITKKVLMEDPKCHFTNLAWNSSGTALAFFQEARDKTDTTDTKLLHYNCNMNKLQSFSLEGQSNIPTKMDTSGIIPLTISDDGQKVFFGVKEKEQLENIQNSESIQIWRTNDNWIYPQQKIIQNWKKTVKTAVWKTVTNQFLAITSVECPKLILDGKQQWALIYNPIAEKPQYKYNDDRDIHAKNLYTGECKLVIEKLPENIQNILTIPNTNYIVYYKNKNWWVLDLNSQTKLNLTEKLNINFEDVHYDRAGDKPTYGIAAWNKKNNSILIYDQYDIWEITVDGKKTTRLTSGKEKQICFRIPKRKNGTWNKINFDGLSCSEVDLDQGLILEANGDDLFSGYYIWNRKQKESKIIYANKTIDQLIKASKNNGYVYRDQEYDSPPTLFFNDPSKNNPQKLFESNPQHHNYNWGKSELVHYQNRKGKTLKAILYYPAAYNPIKKYPMIVHVYERQSDELHSYVNPSELDSRGFNRTNFTSQDYFVLLPDISYEIGNPGSSALDCVVAATQKIIDKGLVLPNKIGLIGHSFGGYETSFIVTQTNLFATAIVGAATTDLTSWYLSVGWNNGRPEIWRFENQQWRMGKSLFDDMESYNQNSPILNTKNIKTPLLIWTGENDKQVNANQSIEFFLALKRLEKQATMLVYPNERHALMRDESQRDLSRRIQNWFNYYLKDKLPESWIFETKK
ncbi:alpha/beta hydrolase family protein [Flavobacterium eburneipallidum]|uniref:alpha/beta hydrolase family protein n=1 Tax=Flavobacterium eburneipallidum TaxID=3003263 RepID=UPI0024829EEA|nr:prolyl oligopeptidase family serine peptidase [Flavobacterium eburneipallidum]